MPGECDALKEGLVDNDDYSSCPQSNALVQNETKNTLSDQEESSRNWKMFLGYSCAILMAFTLATSAACSQALGGFVPAFELNCFRFGTQLLITTPIVMYQGLQVDIGVDKKQAVFLVLYSVLFMINNVQYYEASIYLPAGVLGGLESTSMIVLTSLVQLVHGVKCDIPIPLSMLLSISGIVCLTQPAFLFEHFGPVIEIYSTPVCALSQDATVVSDVIATIPSPTRMLTGNVTHVSATQHAKGRILTDQMKGTLLVLGAVVGYVLCMTIQSRYLNDLKNISIIFVMSAVGLVLTTLVMLCTETPTFPTDPLCVLLVVGHSVTAALGSCFGVVAVAFVPPIIFSLLASLQLFFFIIAQYTALKNINPGHRNWLEIVGAILVFAASVLGPFYLLYKSWTDGKASKTTANELEMKDK